MQGGGLPASGGDNGHKAARLSPVHGHQLARKRLMPTVLWHCFNPLIRGMRSEIPLLPSQAVNVHLQCCYYRLICVFLALHGRHNCIAVHRLGLCSFLLAKNASCFLLIRSQICLWSSCTLVSYNVYSLIPFIRLPCHSSRTCSSDFFAAARLSIYTLLSIQFRPSPIPLSSFKLFFLNSDLHLCN
jgi:hypothetical protein